MQAFLADKSPDAWDARDRCAARVAALRRALGTPLARRRALRRLRRLRAGLTTGPTPGGIATTSSQSFNQDKPYDAFIKEQIAGDELDGELDETLIATGFLRAGPRVNFREKDNPERRWDYLDDLIATVRPRHAGTDGQLRALPQSQVRSDSAEGLLQPRGRDHRVRGNRSAAGAARPKPRRIQSANKAIDAKQAPLQGAALGARKAVPRAAEGRIHQERVPRERAARRVQARGRADARRAAARHAGAHGGGGVTASRHRQGADARRARAEEGRSSRKSPRSRSSGRRRCRWPRSSPTATSASRRSGKGDEAISCPKCRIPPADLRTACYLHDGPGTYEPPPSHFLIRGDPDSQGSLMKPGFVTVATIGNPPTEIPPADGKTSGRRRALGEWISVAAEPAHGARHRQPRVGVTTSAAASSRRSTTSARWESSRRIPNCSTGWPWSS